MSPKKKVTTTPNSGDTQLEKRSGQAGSLNEEGKRPSRRRRSGLRSASKHQEPEPQPSGSIRIRKRSIEDSKSSNVKTKKTKASASAIQIEQLEKQVATLQALIDAHQKSCKSMEERLYDDFLQKVALISYQFCSKNKKQTARFQESLDSKDKQITEMKDGILIAGAQMRLLGEQFRILEQLLPNPTTS